MSLDDWIRGTAVGAPATATPATSATVRAPKAAGVATVAAVAVAEPRNQKPARSLDPVQGRAALELVTKAGARILPHHLQTIEVPKPSDTPELREALALLGYGSYSVAHLVPERQTPDEKERQQLWELYDRAEEAINSY